MMCGAAYIEVYLPVSEHKALVTLKVHLVVIQLSFRQVKLFWSKMMTFVFCLLSANSLKGFIFRNI